MSTRTASPPASSAPDAPGVSRASRTLVTALAPAVWGTTYLVTSELLPAGHPMFAALVRALPAGLLALLIARALPSGSWWWKSAVLGALNIGVFFPLLFVAAERLPGGVAATLGAIQPIIVTLLAVVVLSERLSRRHLAWGAIGVLGVGLVVLGPDAALDPVGITAGLTGAASMAAGSVLTKRWGRPAGVSAVGFAGWQLTAGGLVLLLPALLVEGVPEAVDLGAAGGYFWLAVVGGLVAYTFWFEGLRTLPVTATALLGLLSPLVAAALGILVLGESLDGLQVIGFALALAALSGGQLSLSTRSSSGRRA